MKNKYMRRLASLMLAAAVAATAAMPAFAAEPPAQPDLTRTDCSITVHKYTMPSTAEWPSQPNKTGEPTAVQDSNAKPRAGVRFNIYKVLPIDASKPIVQDDGKLVGDLAHLQVVDAEGHLVPAALKANNLKLDDRYTHEWTGVTDAQGALDFKSLRTGVYLVAEVDAQEVPGRSDPDTAIADPADPFIVNLPLQYKDDKGVYHYNYSVHVYPKNGTLTIDKDVQHVGNDDHTADIAEEETWIVLPSVPHDIARARKYTMTDDLDDRLNYKDGQTVVVKPADASGKPLEGKTLTAAGGSVANPDYTVTPPTANQSGGRLVVDFTAAGRKKLAAYGAKRVYISFITRINDSVIEGSLGENIPNNATIHYTNFYGTSEEPDVPEDERPEVHTGGAKIIKLKAGTDTKLAGAEFQIYRSEADAKQGINPVTVTDQEGHRVTTVTTNKDGVAAFYGLRYGPQAELSEVPGAQQGLDAKDSIASNATRYWAKETKAPTMPEEMNLLTELIPFTVGSDSHGQVIALPTKNVYNTPKWALPITGGMGTDLIALGGAAIMAGAGYAIYRARRGRKHD